MADDPNATPIPDPQSWWSNITQSVKDIPWINAGNDPSASQFDPKPFHAFLKKQLDAGQIDKNTHDLYAGYVNMVKENYDKMPVPNRPAGILPTALHAAGAGLLRAGGASPDALVNYNEQWQARQNENQATYNAWEANRFGGPMQVAQNLGQTGLSLAYGQNYARNWLSDRYKGAGGTSAGERVSGAKGAPQLNPLEEYEVENQQEQQKQKSQIYPTTPPPGGAPDAGPNAAVPQPPQKPIQPQDVLGPHSPAWTEGEANQWNDEQRNAPSGGFFHSHPAYYEQGVPAPQMFAWEKHLPNYDQAGQPPGKETTGRGPIEARTSYQANGQPIVFHNPDNKNLYESSLIERAREMGMSFAAGKGVIGGAANSNAMIGQLQGEPALKAIIDQDTKEWKESQPYQNWVNTQATRTARLSGVRGEIENASDTSAKAMQGINVQTEILKKMRDLGLNTGAGANWKENAYSFTHTAGIDGWINQLTGGDVTAKTAMMEALNKLSTGEVFGELSQEVSPSGEQPKAGTVPMPRGIALITKVLPNLVPQLTNTNAGNDVVNAYARSRHELNLEVGREAQRYAYYHNGQIDENFLAWMRQRQQQTDHEFMGKMAEAAGMDPNHLARIDEAGRRGGLEAAAAEAKKGGGGAGGVDAHVGGLREFMQRTGETDPKRAAAAYKATLPGGGTTGTFERDTTGKIPHTPPAEILKKPGELAKPMKESFGRVWGQITGRKPTPTTPTVIPRKSDLDAIRKSGGIAPSNDMMPY